MACLLSVAQEWCLKTCLRVTRLNQQLEPGLCTHRQAVGHGSSGNYSCVLEKGAPGTAAGHPLSHEAFLQPTPFTAQCPITFPLGAHVSHILLLTNLPW